jgi:hypothetical protein
MLYCKVRRFKSCSCRFWAFCFCFRTSIRVGRVAYGHPGTFVEEILDWSFVLMFTLYCLECGHAVVFLTDALDIPTNTI